MALSIKNRHVEENARELSRVTRRPLTEIVGEAIEIHLKRAKQIAQAAPHDDFMEKIREIQAQAAKLPILDPRHPDDILYDENGLPK
jgi:antitoxin VapB